MAVRKINLMYSIFGQAVGHKCADCQHFQRINHHGKIYRKCEVYGITQSDATDWKQSNTACGLFPNKPYEGREIVRRVGTIKEPEEDIPGQITFNL